MKKYLFIALAAMGFAACAEKAENNVPVNNGEKEQSYMAVTFTADDLTRAEENLEFAEGTDVERAVNLAYVFFFKENGEAFPVTDGDTSTNSGPNNYIKVDLEKEGENMDNVSDVNKSVLVLKNYKGEYPAQVVAVINWNPTEKASYTLSELQTKITTMGDDTNGYVMSNAVYMDHAGKAKYATDLRVENIVKLVAGESEEDAKARAAASPVVIQVERVAAKVEFSAKQNGKFAVGEVNGKTVFAQITGFELYNDYEESWLIKRINTSWSNIANFGMTSTWNDADWKRSYWAQSLGKPFGENNTFSWDLNGVAEDVNHSAFADGEAENPVYCGENTREWTEAKDVRTKVIVTAQLVEQDGTTPVELVQWYGKYYVTEEAGRTVVANTLANNYYFSTDNQNFTGIEGGDLKCVMRAVTDAKAFEVYFQLSDAGFAKTWYEYKDGSYVPILKEELNARLATVEPALVYANGMTYYYTDIKHLGTPDSTTEFGVVRNHVYRVRIDKVVGYGTPIYDGSVNFITPEKPVDVSTYVAAQINILSWRVVDPGYEI